MFIGIKSLTFWINTLHAQLFNCRSEYSLPTKEKALQNLVEWHVKQGTHTIVPTGTTGESPTLRVIQLVVHFCVFFIVGDSCLCF